MSESIKRATGLLIIEVVNSNANGDPDLDSDPRQRPNNIGEISAPSVKRKFRDLVENKSEPFKAACERIGLNSEEFRILESRDRDRVQIKKEMGDITRYDEEVFLKSPFVKKYWDARLFGNTFLEEGGNKGYIKTGVAQFVTGISVAPIVIRRHTNTGKASVQDDKSSSMAPLAYRIVEHGVYYMPFYINPSHALKSGCTKRDIDLLKFLIPYAYDHTRSAMRPDVRIRHAWYMEHPNPLGGCADWKLVDALTPKRKGEDPMKPSASWDDYEVPVELPADLKGKVSFEDLMETVYC